MTQTLEDKRNSQGTDFVSGICFLTSCKNPSRIDHIILLISTVCSLNTSENSLKIPRNSVVVSQTKHGLGTRTRKDFPAYNKP